MTIKADRWIRQMALEQGMIEPFVEGQVRNGVISYGLSSYGYDMRVADEFKVFTNVFNTLVDPKHFDPRSFVDIKADHCDIPPNSFALARSVELFRIPRNVLAICLGKSTYARCGIILNTTPFEPCFSSDTEILTPDGWKLIRDVSVGDSVMGMREDGVAVWQPVQYKQAYGYDGTMLHFDGKSIDLLVTPEHALYVRRRDTNRTSSGSETSYKEKFTSWHRRDAKEVFGKHNYEMSRRVIWEGTDTDEEIIIGDTVINLDTFLEFLGLYIGDGWCYKHKGGYTINIAAFKEREISVAKDVLERMNIRFSRNAKGYIFFNKDLYDYLKPLGHSHEKYIPKWAKDLPPHRLEHLIYGLMNSDGNLETGIYTTASKQLADDVQEVFYKAGYAAIVREIEPPELDSTHQDIKTMRVCYKVRRCERTLDPKVKPDIHKQVLYRGMVYDVTVPGHIIFVRRNGKAVWSGNCWRGYVTLEISNTTPLPARIYANEGIGQVLFFESDEECETSYSDKQGKYLDQIGVVLPRL